ncbi:MAG TPA: hypothetical protein VJM82_00510 [Nitrospiraceae bacterium]|nr:hypothetical protein [Nitrospiraceae bacterium]
MAQTGNVLVEAYAGYKGEETPRAFIAAGVRREVREIVQRWYTDRHSYFKLRADDNRRYVLRYDMDDLIWELVMRESPRDEQ